MPKLITVCPYLLVTGTIFSAPKVSPYITRERMTLAITSPCAPSSMACCSLVSCIATRVTSFSSEFVNSLTSFYHPRC